MFVYSIGNLMYTKFVQVMILGGPLTVSIKIIEQNVLTINS